MTSLHFPDRAAFYEARGGERSGHEESLMVEARGVKHTPGPWQLGKGFAGHDSNMVYGAGDLKDATHVASAAGWTREEAEANARLIAAAPEFFAAAEEALRYVSDDQMVVDSSTPFMVMLAAAYKKALDARPL